MEDPRGCPLRQRYRYDLRRRQSGVGDVHDEVDAQNGDDCDSRKLAHFRLKLTGSLAPEAPTQQLFGVRELWRRPKARYEVRTSDKKKRARSRPSVDWILVHQGHQGDDPLRKSRAAVSSGPEEFLRTSWANQGTGNVIRGISGATEPI